MSRSPYDFSLASLALFGAKQSRDHLRPAVDLALHEAGHLGRAHGFGFERVLLDVALHLRPLQGVDDLAVGAFDDVGSEPGRSRERIPCRRRELGMAEFAQGWHVRTVDQTLPGG